METKHNTFEQKLQHVGKHTIGGNKKQHVWKNEQRAGKQTNILETKIITFETSHDVPFIVAL